MYLLPIEIYNRIIVHTLYFDMDYFDYLIIKVL